MGALPAGVHKLREPEPGALRTETAAPPGEMAMDGYSMECRPIELFFVTHPAWSSGPRRDQAICSGPMMWMTGV